MRNMLRTANPVTLVAAGALAATGAVLAAALIASGEGPAVFDALTNYTTAAVARIASLFN